MNFKFLFPTFRNRYLYVREQLRRLSKLRSFERTLNLGTGEGDYDRMIAGFVKGEVIGCDVNEDDLNHARQINGDVPNLRYEINDALALSYPDAGFDLVVSCEVIEHVGQPAQMIREISRVLKPGGYAVMTFPSREFPFTYDPVNRIWQTFKSEGCREYAIPQGAYAFGHEYLIGSADFKKWCAEAGLEIHAFRSLSGYFTGLLEMYWTGVVQRLFKKNAGNLDSAKPKSIVLRPSDSSVPSGVWLTDVLLFIDRELFTSERHSVGKGVLLYKPVR